MEKVNRVPPRRPEEAARSPCLVRRRPRARQGQRSYAELTGWVYSRPALCLDILALLTASLTTDGSKTFIMLRRAELQTIAENCEKFNSVRAAQRAPAVGMCAFKLIKEGRDD